MFLEFLENFFAEWGGFVNKTRINTFSSNLFVNSLKVKQRNSFAMLSIKREIRDI